MQDLSSCSDSKSGPAEGADSDDLTLVFAVTCAAEENSTNLLIAYLRPDEHQRPPLQSHSECAMIAVMRQLT